LSFHEGELAVQVRAGVLAAAERTGRMVQRTITPARWSFLTSRRFAVLAAQTTDRSVWTSIVTGPLGFLEIESEGAALHVHANVHPADPLASALVEGTRVGLVVIDFEARRRFRVNGHIVSADDGLRLAVDEAYGNCPKYIQSYVPRADGRGQPSEPSEAKDLDAAQTAWISRADTFFLGTVHPAVGADASHRGGAPGFVRVLNPTELAWGDYWGNTLFNSLGNAAVEPAAGLLFIDFETGSTLQLSGRLAIDWSPEAAADVPGAERVVRFQILRVIQTDAASPLRWILSEPSPFNPPSR
jgi:predicted pyridoxine 5'-phosphate oxidase superfamily flavin-nucleotide-binding protein